MSCHCHSRVGASWICCVRLFDWSLLDSVPFKVMQCKSVYGVVGRSIIFADIHEELDLVSWDEGSNCLILQPPCTWSEFAFVLSYSGLPVFIPNCVAVAYECAMHKGFHSDDGSVMGYVEEMVGSERFEWWCLVWLGFLF